MSLLRNLTVTPAISASDVFGAFRVAEQFNQLDISFYRDTAANLLTIATTNGGTATSNTSQGWSSFNTNANPSGTCTGTTKSTLTYRGGAEIFSYMSLLFTAPTSANSFQYGIIGNLTNGFFVGYNGTNFGVGVIQSGVTTFIPQASFNMDTLTGTAGSLYTNLFSPTAITPTSRLIVYRIRFGWLGAAPTFFEVMSPDGVWVLFHILRFSGTIPSIGTADLPITIAVNKTAADATALSVVSGCLVGGTTNRCTQDNIIPNLFSVTNTVLTVSTGPCSLYGYHITNPGALAYIQFFNVATGTTVTLGTTVPTMSIGVVSTGTPAQKDYGQTPRRFSNGLKIAATTTYNGLTAPASAQIVNIDIGA